MPLKSGTGNGAHSRPIPAACCTLPQLEQLDFPSGRQYSVLRIYFSSQQYFRPAYEIGRSSSSHPKHPRTATSCSSKEIPLTFLIRFVLQNVRTGGRLMFRHYLLKQTSPRSRRRRSYSECEPHPKGLASSQHLNRGSCTVYRDRFQTGVLQNDRCCIARAGGTAFEQISSEPAAMHR